MTDVEKYEILHKWHLCDVENVAIYAKFMQFLPQFTRFHVEKRRTGVRRTSLPNPPPSVIYVLPGVGLSTCPWPVQLAALTIYLGAYCQGAHVCFLQ